MQACSAVHTPHTQTGGGGIRPCMQGCRLAWSMKESEVRGREEMSDAAPAVQRPQAAALLPSRQLGGGRGEESMHKHKGFHTTSNGHQRSAVRQEGVQTEEQQREEATAPHTRRAGAGAGARAGRGGAWGSGAAPRAGQMVQNRWAGGEPGAGDRRRRPLQRPGLGRKPRPSASLGAFSHQLGAAIGVAPGRRRGAALVHRRARAAGQPAPRLHRRRRQLQHAGARHACWEVGLRHPLLLGGQGLQREEEGGSRGARSRSGGAHAPGRTRGPLPCAAAARTAGVRPQPQPPPCVCPAATAVPGSPRTAPAQAPPNQARPQLFVVMFVVINASHSPAPAHTAQPHPC